MVGEILAWNPDYPPQLAQRAIQNSYRRILDSRRWFGCLVKGQVTVPNMITGGTVTVTNGSATVNGSGTAFAQSMIGFQFRIGYTVPTYTIIAVPNSSTLTLDIPWGGPNFTNTSYQIYQSIVNFGNNLKRVMTVVNQMQGYRMILDMNQQVLNISDAWRSTVGWTFLVASYIPTSGNTTVPAGVPQFELYPAPVVAQAFPYLAYIQPPDLTQDSQTPIFAIRSDVLVLDALPDALTWKKDSVYYNPDVARMKREQFKEELEKMIQADNDCSQKDLLWEFSKWPLAPIWGSGNWGQMHDQSFWPGG